MQLEADITTSHLHINAIISKDKPSDNFLFGGLLNTEELYDLIQMESTSVPNHTSTAADNQHDVG